MARKAHNSDRSSAWRVRPKRRYERVFSITLLVAPEDKRPAME